VSALLHAVAVVKAGVFTVLKVSTSSFGPELISTLPAANWILWVAAATIVIASLVALTKDDLKARLAWSTVGQLAYITSAAMLPWASGLIAGGLHIGVPRGRQDHALHARRRDLCRRRAPAVYRRWADGRRHAGRVRALHDRGASVIGLPPMAGMWSKFLLVSAAFGSNADG